MSRGVRNSQQRNRILELLQEERIHVPASWLHEHLQSEFPRVSLGNVYRNLDILVRQGVVRRLPLGDSFDVFEAARDDHHHLICDVCGKIQDLHHDDRVVAAARDLAQSQNFQVTSVVVEIHGVCLTCRNGESADRRS